MSTQENTANTSSARMPALFIGHGNPMNAITENIYRDTWLALGKTLPRPKAILMVSAHWQTHGTQVCLAAKPETIHDFGGFPAALFEQRYPAPGAPSHAETIRRLYPDGLVAGSHEWGLDHGAWTVLQSLFPAADVPVFQLSLNVDLDFAGHFAFAKQLASLREQGVMIIGSGNIVHNLRMLSSQGNTAAWALEFDQYVKTALESGNDEALMHIERAGNSYKLAVPTDEHYLPLLYIAAVRAEDEQPYFLTESFDLGTLSMRSVAYGITDRPIN